MNSTVDEGEDVALREGLREGLGHVPAGDARSDRSGSVPADPAGPAETAGRYGIGQAARELGLSVRALRYYQEVGLLTPSGRTSGGNRLYAEPDLARVRRILELKQLMGFNLDEIRIMLTHEDRLAQVRLDYHASSDTAERARLLDAAEEAYIRLRAEVDEKIGRLTAFRDELSGRLERVTKVRAELFE